LVRVAIQIGSGQQLAVASASQRISIYSLVRLFQFV
jgi:hypothetical protein